MVASDRPAITDTGRPVDNVLHQPTDQDARTRDLRRSIRFESAVPIQFESHGRACPLLVVVKRLKPLAALSGTVYRLTSSMSDHRPVFFNVFEREEMYQEEADQDVADEVSEEVHSRGKVMRSEKND